MRRMDRSKALETDNEDTSSSSSQQSPSESSYLNYMEALSPIKQPVITSHVHDSFVGDELDFQSIVFTPPPLALPYDRGIAEDKVLIDTNTLISPLSEETVHQEKPACVYEQGKKQDAELHSNEWIKEVCNSNMSADAVMEEQTYHVSKTQASQEYRAPKRCLQIDETASNAQGSNNPPISAHIPEESLLSAPSYVAEDIRAPPSSGNFPAVTLSKPYCDFGLYSNGLKNDEPLVPFATAEVRLLQGLGRKRTKDGLVISPPNEGKSSSAHIIISTINERHRNDVPKVAADFITSENPSLIEHFIPSCLASVRISSAGVENSEKLINQSESQKKKRPRTTDTAGTGGLKGCKCKKSACMKLYCECFVAERFCHESCGCIGCSNKQEYHNKVNDSKQKIKSRNALAFAPKIVQNGTHIPSNSTENDDLKTPSSAKHKRGCTCRKSKCEKKYCECYAGKVGCSRECRCEGCENSYGRKEEHGDREDFPSKEKDNDRVGKVSDLSHASQLGSNQVNGVSSPTPSLPCSDVRQSSVSLTYVRHVIPLAVTPASTSSASLACTQFSQQSRLGLSSSSFGTLINGGKHVLNSVTSFTPSNPSNAKERDPSQGGSEP